MNKIHPKRWTIVLAVLLLCCSLTGCKDKTNQPKDEFSSAVSIAAGSPSDASTQAASSQSTHTASTISIPKTKETIELIKQYPKKNIKMDDLFFVDKQMNQTHKLGCSKRDFLSSGFTGDQTSSSEEEMIRYFSSSVYFKNQKLCGFTFYEPIANPDDFAVKNNITIGSTREEVLKAYGSPSGCFQAKGGRLDYLNDSGFIYVYFYENNQLTLLDLNMVEQKACQDTSRLYFLEFSFEEGKTGLQSKIRSIFMGNYRFAYPFD